MWPFSLVALGLSGVSMARGCGRSSEGPALPRPSPLNLALGIIYLIHWFVVIPWVTLKMALLPKSLVWAKTAHGHGAGRGDGALALDRESEAEADEVAAIEIVSGSGGS